jgi:RNA polymerase sigma factor for flagellar operon FliA
MPSRRPTTKRNSRRTPRLTLVRAPKGAKKPVRAARAAAPVRAAKAVAPARAVAARPAPPVRAKVSQLLRVAMVRTGVPSGRTARPAPGRATGRKPAPLALVPSRDPKVATVPVERVPREQLLQRYTPLIKYVVERLAIGLPKNVDHEDLMSAGILGLLDAYDKFDSGKGTKFETYAVWRIKGAVLDQLRALDWASRSIRRKAREVDASVRRLDQRLGRQANEEEIAKEAKMPLSEYHRLMDQVRGAVLLSLDEVRTPEDGDSIALGDLIEDPSTPDVLARIEEEETRHLLLETLNQLPEQERVVVALYYYEHMTLREIGLTLGISESRVSQVHSRAVIRLKSRVRRALAA